MKKIKSNKNKMKQLVLTSFMSLGMVFGSAAMNSSMATPAVSAKSSSKTKSSNSRSVSEGRTTAGSKKAAIAKDRADHLSDQMITKLKLNNYQARKVREINLDKISKMMDIEQQYANDPEAVTSQCKGVCNQRDAEFEDLLSTDQYSKYFGSRNSFNKYDNAYAQRLVKPADEAESLAVNIGGGSSSAKSDNQTIVKE